MKTNQITASLILALFVTGISSCGGDAGTRVGNPESSEAFPSSLAIASPTEVSDSESASVSSFLTGASPLHATSMAEAQTQIDAMLNGTTYDDCDFDIAALTEIIDDADCYGPTVAYIGHPEGSPSSSGSLPPGDVGMWLENNVVDEDTNEACAAAEMNALIANAENKAGTAQLALASMLCVVNVNALTLTGTIDLTDVNSEDLMAEMVAETGMEASFSSASITKTTVDDVTTYDYSLVFATTDVSPTTVTVNMTHTPLDDTNSTFTGKFNYRFSTDAGGLANCSETDVTNAGAVSYEQDSSTSLKFQVDEAKYCGTDVDVFATSDELDPTDLYNSSSNTNGWSDDWSTFMASLNPATTAGTYVYFWQAGRLDSNARVFNLVLEEDDAADDMTGTAYFGFGPSVDTEATATAPGSDGHIEGFICNWAGPGADHDYSAYVQYQSMSPDNEGYYQSDASNLSYAPTTSCDYRTTDSGFGSFRFDQDGSGVTDAGDPAPTDEVINDLLDVTDINNDGYLEEIDISFPIL